MQKKPYFHTTAAVKKTRTISINAFNNCNTHYNDKFLDTVKLLPKSVIGLQKINKQTKSILVAVQDLKIFGIAVSEHIKPVYSTQFHLPKNQNYQS